LLFNDHLSQEPGKWSFILNGFEYLTIPSPRFLLHSIANIPSRVEINALILAFSRIFQKHFSGALHFQNLWGGGNTTKMLAFAVKKTDMQI
jgi:hypothetical protein